jgi:AraC-like DNA-binding protein
MAGGLDGVRPLGMAMTACQREVRDSGKVPVAIQHDGLDIFDMMVETRPAMLHGGQTALGRQRARGRLVCISHWETLAQRALYRAPELARLCDVSVRQLQRHIKATFDCGLCSWLGELRVKQARERLQAGWRVDEVAYSLGYKQVSHFSRVFRRRYGCAPSTVQRSEPSMRRFQPTWPRPEPSVTAVGGQSNGS